MCLQERYLMYVNILMPWVHMRMCYVWESSFKHCAPLCVVQESKAGVFKQRKAICPSSFVLALQQIDLDQYCTCVPFRSTHVQYQINGNSLLVQCYAIFDKLYSSTFSVTSWHFLSIKRSNVNWNWALECTVLLWLFPSWLKNKCQTC